MLQVKIKEEISMQKNKSVRLAAFTLAGLYIAAVVTSVMLALGSTASAASLSQVLVRFDRMKASTFTSGTVCAKAANAGQTSVTVTFPTAYTVSGTTGDWATSTANLAWPATASAWPSIGASASGVVGKAVTWSSGALVSGTLYCFNWTNSTTALETSVAGTYSGTVETNVDTAISFATAAIADDQIVVSATVAPSFTFALSGNSDNLGALSTGSVSVSPTPRTATVNTNAKNGWYVWAKDASTGLNSTTASATIASTTPGSNSTLSAGTEGYNTGVTQSQVGGTGTVTVAAPFVGGSAGKGGGLDTTLRTLASSTGTAQTAVLTLTNNAAISSLTLPATDYTDTITVVGAGLF
ncbi:hypothetical protein IPL85_01150 [Candidatus Saccharibacteria bacterium]|nr:MAG: hypothetical protein IPL85_01150 [Candidatus Saccharibacteria bacterium]